MVSEFSRDIDEVESLRPEFASVFSSITIKQHEVFALIAQNRTSKEIAGRLGITESAVNQRIETVRGRTGFPPRAELARSYRIYADALAARKAREEGLIQPAVPSGDIVVGWPRQGEDWVVPAAMRGDNAGLNRVAAMVVIAAGSLVVVMAALGVANALSAIA